MVSEPTIATFVVYNFNIQDVYTPQNITSDWPWTHFSTHLNACSFISKNARTLTHFIFANNVRIDYVNVLLFDVMTYNLKCPWINLDECGYNFSFNVSETEFEDKMSITGSAFALHGCKAHAKINKKWEIRPPVKS